MSNTADIRVVVTGMGVASSLGCEVESFWQNVINGECGIDRVTSFDVSDFACQIAAEIKDFDPTPAFPNPKEVRRADRFTQLGIYAAWKALQDSSMNLDELDRDQIGCFIGSGIGGLGTQETQHSILTGRGPAKMSPFTIPMLILNMASGCSQFTMACVDQTLPPAALVPPAPMRWVRHGAQLRWAMPRPSSPVVPKPPSCRWAWAGLLP